MNKRAKLLDTMRNNPRDWRIEDLLVVAKQFGIECRNRGGSHYAFGFQSVEMDVTVPAHRPIKPVYIRQFLLLVDTVKELKQ
ncbi:MAG: type II toxin-antitoxin system HicA family toxin [Nitrosomonadales bacterium]|nr:type II toxin-antitoxin system HicA family toxin [Nitrosomonadales bacterium]